MSRRRVSRMPPPLRLEDAERCNRTGSSSGTDGTIRSRSGSLTGFLKPRRINRLSGFSHPRFRSRPISNRHHDQNFIATRRIGD
jgi:hypothetical protein